MGYTKKDCLKFIDESFDRKDLNALYKENFICYTGKSTDTHESYQEIFAARIMERLQESTAKELPYVTKLSFAHYCKNKRDLSKKGEGEEEVQRQFAKGERSLQKEYGKFLWFELRVNANGKGVDLVYYNEEKQTLNLFEVKHDSSESLLRAALELQTYFQKIDWDLALDELRTEANKKGMKMPEDHRKVRIQKYVLLNGNCKSEKNTGEYMKKLMSEAFFDIKVIHGN